MIGTERSRGRRIVMGTLALVCLCWGGVVVAHTPDEAAATDWPQGGAGQVGIERGVPALEGLLFVGTCSNLNDPAGTLNDVFTLDPTSDMSVSVLTGVQVWGATADLANERILFTRASGMPPPDGEIGGGDELFSVPFAGGAPTSLGRITNPAGGFRVDGLAMVGDVLYGTNAGAGAGNGFYSIDLMTLAVTEIALFVDSISGIDADPSTGTIYGVNDTTGQLVTIDATTGAIANVAAYPVGLTDIDGLAVGGGFAYLVTDEGGDFAVYDIMAGTYGTPLTSPFTSADTFSGGAIASGVAGLIFADSFESGDTSAW
ncbi:MAG: hypothetical protein AAF560_12280 [Acidobacteriota bacterium]